MALVERRRGLEALFAPGPARNSLAACRALEDVLRWGTGMLFAGDKQPAAGAGAGLGAAGEGEAAAAGAGSVAGAAAAVGSNDGPEAARAIEAGGGGAAARAAAGSLSQQSGQDGVMPSVTTDVAGPSTAFPVAASSHVQPSQPHLLSEEQLAHIVALSQAACCGTATAISGSGAAASSADATPAPGNELAAAEPSSTADAVALPGPSSAALALPSSLSDAGSSSTCAALCASVPGLEGVLLRDWVDVDRSVEELTACAAGEQRVPLA